MQKKRRRIFNHKMLGVFEKLGNEVATLILVCFLLAASYVYVSFSKTC